MEVQSQTPSPTVPIESPSVQTVRSPAEYWKCVTEISILMRTLWEEDNDFHRFLTVLKEKRDDFSLHIISDAISPLPDIVTRFTSIRQDKEGGDYLPPREILEGEEEEPLLSLSLRKALRILREVTD